MTLVEHPLPLKPGCALPTRNAAGGIVNPDYRARQSTWTYECPAGHSIPVPFPLTGSAWAKLAQEFKAMHSRCAKASF